MSDSEIYLPKETVSDDEYLVSAILKPSGSRVEVNEAFAVFETSKSAIEILSESTGILHHNLTLNARIKVGTLIAMVTAESRTPAKLKTDALASQQDGRFSKAAEELIRAHMLDRSMFGHLGFVKKQDVEMVLKDMTPKQSAIQTAAGSRLKILVIGGGGHAKMCIDILRQTNAFEIAGILDSVLEKGAEVLNVPVLGKIEDMKRFRDAGIAFAINGIGAADKHTVRERIFRSIKDAGFIVPNLIHPNASIEQSCIMGEGNQFMAGCIVGSAVTIGDNCIINSNSVVSHDCKLADNVHVAPGSILGGEVEVGSNSLIGMGCTIYMHLIIGSYVTVVNGAHIDKSVPDHAIVRR